MIANVLCIAGTDPGAPSDCIGLALNGFCSKAAI